MYSHEPQTIGLRGQSRSLFETLEVRVLLANPSIADVTPLDKAVTVPIDAFIASNVNLVGPGDVVDAVTVSKPGNVTLVRASDNANIPGQANTTGGGDAIIFTPSQPLDLNTKYKFTVTAGVKDTAGRSFTPFSSTFTTASTPPTAPPKDIRFDKVPLNNATGYEFTSIAVGPDRRLYAADLTGYILRFDILDDGSLGASKTIKTVRDNNGGARLITGLIFAGNKNNPDVYVSHGYSSVLNSPNHTGKISKLTGANLENYKDLVVSLPRSYKDHLTNQMAWGPDGAIYISQGSQTAMGAPDNAWGQRSEHLLSGTILRLDLNKLGSSPLNARTSDAGGSYNPSAANAPLTVFATGVRNAYDLVWTSDGHLFAPTNGSASGGNTPAGNGAPALNGVSSQPDYLYRIVQGGYYGHPNPRHGEYVLNGGNPTAGKDPGEVTEYPVGTQPDDNYRGFAWNFGQHFSPNGVIEYKSSAFGGKLKGQLLVAQYSGGDNIVALKRSGGTIQSDTQNIVGFTGFVDPLDLTEDTTTGNIYVAEFGGKRITLLRPDQSGLVSGSQPSTDQGAMYFVDIRGGQRSAFQTLLIKNIGDKPLTVNQLTLTGNEPNLFEIVQKPPLPVKLQPGANFSIKVAFKAAGNSSVGVHTATLRIKSVDSNSGSAKSDYNVALRGYATNGHEGTSEPSLQRIFDLYGYKINVGDPTPEEPRIPLPPAAPNDEVVAQTFNRVDANKWVTIQPIASFSPKGDPIMDVGYYSAVAGDKQHLFSVLSTSYQQVDVDVTGTQRFSPGDKPFGLYFYSETYKRTAHTQDKKNKFSLGKPANGRVVRSYPLKGMAGGVVPNAYVVTVEFSTEGSDQQEMVLILRNAKPTITAPSSVESTPLAPPSNLVVTNTINQIALDWEPSPNGNVVGYIIKRSTNSRTNFIQLTDQPVADSEYVDPTGGPKRYYYRVFAQDTSGRLSDPAKVAGTLVRQTASPAPQQIQLTGSDIGNPQHKGATQANGPEYAIVAGGSDIHGTSDQFHFAHTARNGDFDVKVRVNSLLESDVWAKAGIMVRESLAADARNLMVLTSPSRYRMTYRATPGGMTSNIGVGTPSFPNNWLRLSRKGNVFTGFSSTNGKDWTEIASVTLAISTNVFVGLAVTSHNPSAATEAQFSDLAIL